MGPVDHYFSKKPSSRPTFQTFTWILRGYEFVLKSGSGVFSREKVDKGSQLLIEKCEVSKGQKVLDLGCGYGVVGVVMAKLGCEVTGTDINERAVGLAKENAVMNGVKANFVQGDIYENVKGKFDVILVNPPQTAGKKICFAMIEGAKEHLVKGGTLQLVARHQKGGKSLSKHMEETFSNVDVVAKGSGYRIYKSVQG